MSSLSPFCSLNVWDPDPLYPSTLFVLFPPPPTIALYALGTVISLIGTGFLIGVRLNFFFFVGFLFRRRENMLMLSIFYVQMKTVPQAVETSKLKPAR